MRREEKERNAASLLGSLDLDIDIHPVHLPQLRPASPTWRDWPIVQVASVRQLLSGLRALSLSSSRPQQSGHQSLSHSVGEQDGERASRQTESSLDPAWLGYAIHHGLHARKYAVERERGVRKEERKQRTGRARSVCLPLSQVQSVI